MKTWVVINDVQIPWQDKVALSLAISFIKDVKPHGVILNGDIVDCYAISDFDKDPAKVKAWGLAREISDAGRLMQALKSVPQKVWIGGNHEDRWRRIAWRHPSLAGMLKSFPDAFHMGDHGFKWLPYQEGVRLGRLTVTHGTYVRSVSGATARAHFDHYGTSVLHGHTHRLGAFYKRNVRGVHGAWENGCLCQLDPEYAHHPDWQQGLSVVHVDESGMYNVQQLPILNRRVLFYGKERYRV